jgi:hypothetical protein
VRVEPDDAQSLSSLTDRYGGTSDRARGDGMVAPHRNGDRACHHRVGRDTRQLHARGRDGWQERTNGTGMRTALVQQHFGKRRRDVVIRFHVVAECLESPREISDSQCRRSHVDAAAARAEIHRDTSDSNARQRASWTVVVMFMRPRLRDGSAAGRRPGQADG